MENKRLRGEVYARFKTVGEFAQFMGWGRNKASRIVNGIQAPDSKDIENLAEKLNVETSEEFVDIFFPRMSTKWTIGQGGESFERDKPERNLQTGRAG